MSESRKPNDMELIEEKNGYSLYSRGKNQYYIMNDKGTAYFSCDNTSSALTKGLELLRRASVVTIMK